jgi:hypothetical protein
MGKPTKEQVESILDKGGLWQFLGTKRSAEDLKTALAVLLEFKECESQREWLLHPFATWGKLEQLEDYLTLLIGDGDEDVTDESAPLILAACRERGPRNPAS